MRNTAGRTRRAIVLVTAFVGLGGVLSAPLASATEVAAPVGETVAVAEATASETAVSEAEVAAAPKVSRDEVINRAKVWLTANNGKQVPYSQSKVWKDGYRQDCSGYVSMAAKLAKPGPNTVGLFDSHTVAINRKDLRKGDLLIDKIGGSNSRHVVIFEKWADSAHTKYWAYEQRGGHGTDHRILSYGMSDNSQYKARRLKNITG
ncbi:hypothetical protein LX15_002312 [Streptoalloteichus tenebrarius]|uniref:Uncharacterized protein n=1 Tax=Streptoalloteichus tenebrarius (strain ATCC 17920 / DSM 40477 / JCM 4838 / CBS 697.72 / NBRC 16177 / NCIMB 11028 / NRRL B-12390 / A12253. 1 / ISP 5477) TaxID=1933 RepID=A0ABT1HSV1_STRSD|nr:hypothetical protein [Streptoalloteichus tenebrarius]MCP2258614.1 hypothetical protein [Streptoalloteichus tenebrarius]BFF04013.1 hypothetical protein GCM10020241_56880 [Streptoalloteichus tenebrarius]